MTVRRAGSFLLGRPWLVIGAAALVAGALWVASTRSQPHRITAAFSAALSIAPGLDVQVDGVDVGKVVDVEYADGQARVELGIDDEDVWPLRQGTTAELRFGTTVGNGTRTVQLHPGPRDARPIPEGGALGRDMTQTPVELDQLFDTMDRPTRGRFKRMLRGTGESLEGRGATLGRGLEAAPAGLDAVGGVLSDLAADQQAIAGLVTNADRATATLAARRPQISRLLAVAASTFDTFARDTDGVRASLDDLPSTLRQTRATLGRLSGSLPGLTALVDDVAPGARDLRTLAPVATRAVRELRQTSALGDGVLRSATAHAPDVTALLRAGGPFLERTGKVLGGLEPALGCLRPYGPELAGFLSTWAGYAQNYDATGHYARTHILQGPTSVGNVPLTSKQFLSVVPGTTYALPRPPGLNEGQPRFLPECGAGREALDPAKDPEARP
ncbi:MlaD family protein [Conexibacter sp. SYSU D00693]|uniref:MlaD family protein n=1 Tax=Conexibacter sp. SYSU D00693 TaxID=2812560 RepID=UPI00196B514B|nr:MlaD family protein [Conexibacter sp. SYSU D00693]